MTLTEVYREIDRNGIDVYYFPMESNAKGIAFHREVLLLIQIKLKMK